MSGRRSAGQTGRQIQIPPPVGGLNARDSIANMPPQDALTLDNIFPEASYGRVRYGYEVHATGLPGAVETLMEWSGTSRKFFAASGTAIYDVSSAGAVGAASLSGLTNAKWQFVNFTTPGGNFLVCVNGADGVRTYNGTTWASSAITGMTAANAAQVAVWGNRLWFAENNSTKAWYLPTSSIAGAAASIELGSVWRLGGTLARIVSASFDTMGQGLSDFIGFLSTNGELAVYTGNDPATVGTFALVGRFRMGAPIGTRCSYQSGGDVAIITNDGVLSMMQMLRVDRTEAPRAAITDKIARLFSSDADAYSTLSGWQIIGYPARHMVIVNVPTSSTTAQQYVMNAISGAWCRYTNINAACWGLFSNNLYFGAQSGGVVYKAETGQTDNTANISYAWKSAFNGCGNAAVIKRFTLMRPILTVNSTVNPTLGVDVDYGEGDLTSTSTVAVTGPTWDGSVWDAAVWGGASLNAAPWSSVGKVGRTVAVRLAGQVRGVEMAINAADLVFEPGRLSL